jgi:hypothetical protein
MDWRQICCSNHHTVVSCESKLLDCGRRLHACKPFDHFSACVFVARCKMALVSGLMKESASGFWQDEADECRCCDKAFGFARPKHHCRQCGFLVCGDCSGNTRAFPGFADVQRVCNMCFQREATGGGTVRSMAIADEESPMARRGGRRGSITAMLGRRGSVTAAAPAPAPAASPAADTEEAPECSPIAAAARGGRRRSIAETMAGGLGSMMRRLSVVGAGGPLVPGPEQSSAEGEGSAPNGEGESAVPAASPMPRPRLKARRGSITDDPETMRAQLAAFAGSAARIKVGAPMSAAVAAAAATAAAASASAAENGGDFSAMSSRGLVRVRAPPTLQCPSTVDASAAMQANPMNGDYDLLLLLEAEEEPLAPGTGEGDAEAKDADEGDSKDQEAQDDEIYGQSSAGSGILSDDDRMVSGLHVGTYLGSAPAQLKARMGLRPLRVSSTISSKEADEAAEQEVAPTLSGLLLGT